MNGELSTELNKCHTEFMINDVKFNRQLEILNMEYKTEKNKPVIYGELRNNHNYIKVINEKEKENHKLKILKDLEINKEEFKEIKDKYQNLLNSNRAKIEKLNNDIKDIKNYFNSLTLTERNYYEKILYKGIDTRSDGLVWIARRLLELDSLLEDSLFPKHLDINQISYIKSVNIDTKLNRLH